MDLNTFREYINLHLISLEQDLDQALMGEGYETLKGQIYATKHFMEVLND